MNLRDTNRRHEIKVRKERDRQEALAAQRREAEEIKHMMEARRQLEIEQRERDIRREVERRKYRDEFEEMYPDMGNYIDLLMGKSHGADRDATIQAIRRVLGDMR